MVRAAERTPENRFRLLASRGNRRRGLELLAKLDTHFGSDPATSVGHTLHEDPEPFNGDD